MISVLGHYRLREMIRFGYNDHFRGPLLVQALIPAAANSITTTTIITIVVPGLGFVIDVPPAPASGPTIIILFRRWTTVALSFQVKWQGGGLVGLFLRASSPGRGPGAGATAYLATTSCQSILYRILRNPIQ